MELQHKVSSQEPMVTSDTYCVHTRDLSGIPGKAKAAGSVWAHTHWEPRSHRSRDFHGSVCWPSLCPLFAFSHLIVCKAELLRSNYVPPTKTSLHFPEALRTENPLYDVLEKMQPSSALP